MRASSEGKRASSTAMRCSLAWLVSGGIIEGVPAAGGMLGGAGELLRPPRPKLLARTVAGGAEPEHSQLDAGVPGMLILCERGGREGSEPLGRRDSMLSRDGGVLAKALHDPAEEPAQETGTDPEH